MKKKDKSARQREKNAFWKALTRELREHKSSFIVFYTLRILVIVTMIRQIILGSYESAFFCVLTLLLLYVPSWIQVKLRIELPPALEIAVLCFIFAAEILGEVNAFYTRLPNFDTILHTITLSPLFLALVAFCFSMTIGVLWEFFEFSMDWFFHTDMQRDTIVNAIYSATLDPTRSNQVVAIPDIQDVVINGQSLGLGGYLDLGIIDTMKDLFVNFIGAVVFSVLGFFYAASHGKKRTAAQSFVPSKKSPEQDYLRQAQEQQKQKEIENQS